MRYAGSVISGMIALALVLGAPAPAVAQTILLRAGHLIDPAAGTLTEGREILVRDGVIVEVADEIDVDGIDRVVDLSDSWVLPGLMDSHAEEGFEVDSPLSMTLGRFAPVLTRFGGEELIYEDGVPPEPGTRLVQPELAWTLETIAAEGADAFYRGEIADRIVAEMERGGGLVTHEDLASYRPVWRQPIEAEYRGFPVISMPPASSGGVAIVEALNVLETYDSLPAFHGAAYKHVLAEALRRAFVDRNTELCDPDFCDPPIERLTSDAYAGELRRTIDPDRATPSPPPPDLEEGMHTTHYSVVDVEGNAVATTTTLNGPGGSGVVVGGAGFFLNNEMDDFSTSAGPNMFGLVQGAKNRGEPGKRPLSSMSPTIVLDPEGDVLLVVGGAGGPMILTGTLQMILNVVDHRMSWSDAMHAPRLHHQAWPDSHVRDGGTARLCA